MKTALLPLLMFIVCCCMRVPASGQSTAAKITGRVQDEKGLPVGYATVTLLGASDSALVKGGITDEAGQFQFAGIAKGRYQVAASMMGMSKVYSMAFDAATDVALPPLVLKPDAHQLEGVSITATKPLIEHQPGKTIVNVENSILSAGNSAMDVLKRSPGVSVDNNDNISLQGKQGVTIMINGRPTHLSAQQVADMLKNMPAASLSKIEIMTTPSSKYDAQGSSGIINITLKKQTQEGFNGTAVLNWGQAIYPQAGAGLDLNYKSGKWNLYGGYHFNHRSWSNQLTLYRQYFDAGHAPGDRMVQPSFMRTPNDNHQFNAGADFQLDSNNTIGLLFTGSSSDQMHRGHNTTRIYDPKDALRSYSKSRSSTSANWTNQTYNLHYEHAFDTAGTTLSVNADYSDFHNHSIPHFHNAFFNAEGDSSQAAEVKKGDILSEVKVHSAKMDFSHPFNDKMEMEAGLKVSKVVSDNNVRYWNYQDKQWVADSGKTNHFVYTETISAAYLSLSKTFSKGWSAKAGLRAEHTRALGEQRTIDEDFDRKYLQLFPTLFVQKEVDKNNQMTFSYSRRINRPDYQRLNPFRYYIDPYTYEKGNPMLKPELTRSFELSYLFKNILSLSVNYSHTRDVINEAINVDTAQAHGHSIIYDTRDNVGSVNHFSASLTATLPVTDWWTTNTTVTPLYDHFYGQYQQQTLDNASFALLANSTNTFLLPKGFKAELSGWYHTPLAYGTLDVGGQGQISAGISKSFADDRLNIKCNINDVFDMGGSSGTGTYPDMDLRFENDFSSRRIYVSLSWNFGNQKLKTSRHQSTGIEEEQSRIQK